MVIFVGGTFVSFIEVSPNMAMKDWIKSTAEKIRDAVEQVFPAPARPERVPARVPIPVGTPRPHRRYY
jgi:hypothetical protein